MSGKISTQRKQSIRRERSPSPVQEENFDSSSASDEDNDEQEQEEQKTVVVQQIKKKRKKKDRNIPKRIMTAWIYYSMERYPHVKAANPGLKKGDYTRLIAAEWKNISSAQRVKYDQLNQADKVRYEKAMKDYKQTITTAATTTAQVQE